ncbi:pyocin activator PrtN family protein [Oceanospirillum sediminis]|uniref:Pyocin activator PrtN family protein n=1 Tax=Oceanospirillum sediminis TaxID=2760088 RepID=A0A839IRG5_9GAMM|nr:pyocin activator PrtN family protein [Oceanospirillum sediminis]MBB1487089.1 pyocin activator PrtN family protein [Oceanospirillum sediminis]
MRTDFALLAIYQQTLIPLEVFCTKEMGISFVTAKNQLSANIFPIPVIRENRKLLVHIDDAAHWIDTQRKKAINNTAA